jgi:transcriptional regulator NrdR family protein
MTCPVCGEKKTKVINVRDPDCEHIWRRRECTACGFRFSTVEYEVEHADIQEKETTKK